ncbi:hypothetical protein AVEN_154695-1 [Araneus ventricosus]|uniref:Methyltransferase domain-containing protein n=1 Tax=Araneus ventricosus TaxID=182803 RepID=A0A4Y2PDL8_ARAVE|nr:hypothetical protein AVEN_154695-1 [Araneus ventricosus]
MISSQQYERPDQATAYSKFRLEPPQELLDVIISYLNEEIPMPFGQAVDVGCGSGQSTVVLAPYFRSVIGCDVSKSQIREAALARKVSNVEYREADRVLAPGGVLSIYSSAAMYPITGDDETDNLLKFLTNKFLYDDLKPYRSSRVEQVFEQYRNIEFPFDDIVRRPLAIGQASNLASPPLDLRRDTIYPTSLFVASLLQSIPRLSKYGKSIAVLDTKIF